MAKMRRLRPRSINIKYLFIVAFAAVTFFPNCASAAKGHCNISADAKWIEKQTSLYTASEDPNITIKGLTHKQFNELVKSEKSWLGDKKRTFPQAMSRCGNLKNLDGTKDRPSLGTLKEFDQSLSSKKNLTCLCDNKTKDDKAGGVDPLTAKVADPPNFADPANPPAHAASPAQAQQGQLAPQPAPVLSQNQETIATLANPGSLSSDQQQMIADGNGRYSYLQGGDVSPKEQGWTAGSTFKDDKGRSYQIWTQNGVSVALRK